MAKCERCGASELHIKTEPIDEHHTADSCLVCGHVSYTNAAMQDHHQHLKLLHEAIEEEKEAKGRLSNIPPPELQPMLFQHKRVGGRDRRF